jgi:hypothetical protein
MERHWEWIQEDILVRPHSASGREALLQIYEPILQELRNRRKE